MTSVKVTHIGEDYGKVIVIKGDETVEYEVSLGLAQALQEVL